MKKTTSILAFVMAALAVFTLYSCSLNVGGDNASAANTQLPFSTNDSLHASQTPDGMLTLTAALDNPYYLTENGSDYVYFYVNLKAKQVPVSQERLPLNISMVIDRSGSMSGEGKMDYAIKAAQTVVSNLADMDKLSIVSYDDYVTVEHKSGKITNKSQLKDALALLVPRGSTNLGAGMLQGYDEVQSTYKSGFINRVLLLSDGLANQGIVDTRTLSGITRDKYSQNGIAISTFGVGADFNEDLMTSLAEYGRGNYYFIDESGKIPGIFEKELNGLLAVTAKNLQLKISYPTEMFEVFDVDGYQYDVVNGQIVVDFNDIVSEEEKVLLVKFKVKDVLNKTINITANLNYTLAYGDKTEGKLTTGASLTPTTDEELYTNSGNNTVYKNVIIYEANKKYEEATKLVDKGEYDKAEELLEYNRLYFKDNMEYVKNDSILLRLQEQNETYKNDLDEIEEMSDMDFKYFQKSNKSQVYENKKRK